jgi:Mg-chelatase subunit ChlD
MTPTNKQALQREGQAIIGSTETTVFVVDTSSSMSEYFKMGTQAEDVSKLEAMQNALREMAKQRIFAQTRDRLGIVSFGARGAQRLLTPAVLLSMNPVEKALREVEAHGSTPMHEGLVEGIKALDEFAEGLARIVLISDGVPDGEEKGHRKILDLVKSVAEEFGIIFDTIGVGATNSGITSYNPEFMRKIAELGKGKFYPISDSASFSRLLKDLEAERRLLNSSVFLLPAAGETEPSRG